MRESADVTVAAEIRMMSPVWVPLYGHLEVGQPSRLTSGMHCPYADVMPRTSLILDAESIRAARQLASKFQCSSSAAIRQAIVRYRDIVLGIPPAERARRKRVLLDLIELSDGQDPQAEVARLKSEDAGF